MKILFLNIGDDGVKADSCAELLRQHATLRPTVKAITLEPNPNRLAHSDPVFLIPEIRHINRYHAIMISVHGVLGNTNDCFRELGGPTTTKKIMDVEQFTEFFCQLFQRNPYNLSRKNIILLNCYGARTNLSYNHSTRAREISFHHSFAGKFSRRFTQKFPDVLFHVTAYTGRVRIKTQDDVGEIAVQTEEQIKLLKKSHELKVMYSDLEILAAALESSFKKQAERIIINEHADADPQTLKKMINAKKMEIIRTNATHRQLSADQMVIEDLLIRLEDACTIETTGYGGVKFRCNQGHCTYRPPKMRSLALVLGHPPPRALEITIDPDGAAMYRALRSEARKILKKEMAYDALTQSLAASSELSTSSVFQIHEIDGQNEQPNNEPNFKR